MTSFIDRLAPIAQKYGKAAGVLPSLLLAQGILESASGTSELAVKANNLFGIKKGSGWSGEVYAKDSKEWSADRGWYSAVSEFRRYPSYAECVEDLLHKYTHGLDWEKHNRYAAVIDETDYRKAAQAVFAAGYATDPAYPEKLIKVIEQYGLSKYDEGVSSVVKKVAIDAGHGMNTAGKRTPAGEREWSFNDKVVRAAIAELNTYSNVEVLRLDDPTGRTDVPLKTRTDRANAFKADVLVSVHHNAMTGRWGNHGGVETFTYTPVSRNPKSKALADRVHPKIVQAMGLGNRGIKGGNLHMVREFKGSAILTEGGFMDSNIDIKAMRNDAKLMVQGVAIAQGIAEYLGLQKGQAETASSGGEKFYRVRKSWTDAKSQVGAFMSFAIAKKAADDAGLNVYDESGKLVHSGGKKEEPKKEEKPVEKDDKHAKPSASLQKEFGEAVEVGITDGTYPNRQATRAEVAVMVLRGMESKKWK
ncbi:glucosaminidase domain-containing protein [Planomicrobium sp. YIM 101495]|uniref:glucosaminidase domain-containing protein n=1 Tax=Planomicrobium sp. YIM 101495 TaxID=2665160 RepID=UPI0012B8C0E7|nr:glucosaminidase domain-containing protein [Planomicrobium sp. YIM 101495]MTD30142.1 hypothetical protein [Planomicrobium sp. YIM 101495]